MLPTLSSKPLPYSLVTCTRAPFSSKVSGAAVSSKAPTPSLEQRQGILRVRVGVRVGVRVRVGVIVGSTELGLGCRLWLGLGCWLWLGLGCRLWLGLGFGLISVLVLELMLELGLELGLGLVRVRVRVWDTVRFKVTVIVRVWC